MTIKLISVGKLKTNYYQLAIADYLSRINKFIKITEHVVLDEKEPNQLSAKAIDLIKQKEAERIVKLIQPKDFIVALVINGKTIDSLAFAQLLNNCFSSTFNNIVFIIGGSQGLDQSIIKQANFLVSFSPMTFAHNLAKLMLCEQIYRGLTIINGVKYHK